MVSYPLFSNLIISYRPDHKTVARLEAKSLLSRISGKFSVDDSSVNGLFFAMVEDPRQVIRRLRELQRQVPTLFRMTMYYTPIDMWTSSHVDDMAAAARKVAGPIDDDTEWKVSVQKRNWSSMKMSELIDALASAVNRGKINLDNPRLILRVEIVGDQAGLSLLGPDDRINLQKDG